MRQTKLFTKTIKDLPKDEQSLNAQLLIRAGFIDKLGAGIYSFLPLGLRTLNKIIAIIKEEMDAIGGQEILMAALVPKDNWTTTDRWDNFDVLFKLQGSDARDYALGATHEEVVTPLVKRQIASYKDLPVAVYQVQTKFRNELRAKAGLMRGREFWMKDMYSFHTNEEDLNEFYKLTQKAYFNIYKRCGLETLTYLTFAAGGAFSKYSHEFQTVTEAGEDLIYICDNCQIAINEEIISEHSECPLCGNKNLKTKKAVEVGNIFKLANRFSKPFDFQFLDQAGERHDVIMGCYGIGPSRVMGTIVEVSHDDRGIIWPEEIAPYKTHLLLLNSDQTEIREVADKLYDTLKSHNIEVLYDDRNETAGRKLADADLIGCPYRIIVSEKVLKEESVEIKVRYQDEPVLVKITKLIEYFNKV